MYKEKEIGYSREFLNKPYMVSTNSNIAYTISLTTYNDNLSEQGLFDSTDISFVISDCNRSINLEFEISNKEAYENSLYKLDKIIETCTKMKNDLSFARSELIKTKKYEKIFKDEENSVSSEG